MARLTPGEKDQITRHYRALSDALQRGEDDGMQGDVERVTLRG
jgi:hypothetical protein